MNNYADIKQKARLILKELRGELDDAERIELEVWKNGHEENRKLYEELMDEKKMGEQALMINGLKERLDEAIYSIIPEAREIIMMRKKNFLLKWAVAASFALAFGVGSYFLFFDKEKKADLVHTQEQRFKNDVDPGKYKARLTLADGRNIVIDSATLGELAKQGNSVVLNKDGQLVYQAGGKAEEVLYNTLSTARGETYSTVLADGSKVWLNSASTIIFPIVFPANERVVKITGEAYFEVAKNAKPFKVEVSGIVVEVLGTHFNINSYADEAVIRTTLLEGSVWVRRESSVVSKKEVVIKPGEQAVASGSGQLSINNDVDLEEVMAWKNGWFHFQGADLKTILRQFARWYNVEVIYEGPVKNRKFIAIVKRSSTLKSVLEMLQDNDILYRIEGSKLIVKSG